LQTFDDDASTMTEQEEDLRHGRSESFGAADRVRRRGEYRRIQTRGTKVHSRRFLWMVHPSLVGADHARLGVVVTKKLGSAVRRNRIKRVLREVFRRHRELFPSASDVVAIAKHGLDVDALGFQDLVDEVRSAQSNLQRAARRAREAARTEATRTDAARTDAARTDAARTDATRTEPTRTDAARSDAARTDAKTSSPAATRATTEGLDAGDPEAPTSSDALVPRDEVDA
jgi:ribonuclease P protein component